MTRLRTRRMRTNQETTVNPMDGLGNLADAMLVLAVGIMLALILNWQVDIGSGTAQPETSAAPEQEPIAITEEDLQDAEPKTLDREDLEQVGALYYDEETGIYYAITGE